MFPQEEKSNLNPDLAIENTPGNGDTIFPHVLDLLWCLLRGAESRGEGSCTHCQPAGQDTPKWGQWGTSAEGGSAPAWPKQHRSCVADIFDIFVASGFGLLHGETSTEWAVLSIQIFYFGAAC